MRYEKGRKEMTRKRIIDIASKRFRRDGIDTVGLAKLMSDAGLTHGGFYNHFRSKEDLVSTALVSSLHATIEDLKHRLQKGGGSLDSLLHTYLHPVHRDRPDRGCAIAALGTEVARRPDETKEAFSREIGEFFQVIERLLPEVPQEKRRETATAIFSTMVGALQLSRIVTDKVLSETILKSGIEAAMALATSSSIS